MSKKIRSRRTPTLPATRCAFAHLALSPAVIALLLELAGLGNDRRTAR